MANNNPAVIWQVKKLGEICKKASSNVSQNQLSNNEGGFPIYGASWFIKNVDFYHQEKEYIGIVKDGAGIGRLSLLPAKSSIIGTMQYILPQEGVDVKFLYYSLLSVDFLKYKQGSTIPHIYFKDYSEEEIVVPTLPEQLRIVSILEEALAKLDQAKENIEKNLQNAKEVFESYLQSVFENPGEGWEEKRFDEICILQRWFDLPTHSRNKGNFPLVSSNGITDRIDLWKVKAPGVITGRSWTIWNIHFVEEDFWPLNTALYIKDFHGNYEKFIYFFLKQFDLSRFSSGAGVPTLNRNNVHSEKVWFPKSITEQKQIVSYLDTLSTETKRLESIYQQKLAHLEELRKSLLKKAFNGEL